MQKKIGDIYKLKMEKKENLIYFLFENFWVHRHIVYSDDTFIKIFNNFARLWRLI